ncbi:hypothetical protein GCM10029992_44960 [Glycomyces albus]
MKAIPEAAQAAMTKVSTATSVHSEGRAATVRRRLSRAYQGTATSAEVASGLGWRAAPLVGPTFQPRTLRWAGRAAALP